MSREALEKSKEEGGGKFIKLKDGEDITGVFVGIPRFFYKKYQDKTEYPKWAEGLNFRFQINFLVKENGVYTAKLIEQGSTFRDTLLSVKEEYGLDCVYKIKRKGSGKEDTLYSILFKEKLSPEQMAELKKVKLNDLRPNKTPPPPYDDERNIQHPDDMEFDDDIPF